MHVHVILFPYAIPSTKSHEFPVPLDSEHVRAILLIAHTLLSPAAILNLLDICLMSKTDTLACPNSPDLAVFLSVAYQPIEIFQPSFFVLYLASILNRGYKGNKLVIEIYVDSLKIIELD